LAVVNNNGRKGTFGIPLSQFFHTSGFLVPAQEINILVFIVNVVIIQKLLGLLAPTTSA
jgi:hypothetical protein